MKRLIILLVNRGFVPVTLLAIFLYSSEYHDEQITSELSFVVAFGQIISNFDGGVLGYLINSEKKGIWFSLLKRYVFGILKKKIIICCCLTSALYFLDTEYIKLPWMVVFFSSLLIAVNLVMMEVAKKDDRGYVILYFCSAIITYIILFLMAVNPFIMLVILLLNMFLVASISLPLSRDLLDEGGFSSFQFAQILSSVLINKEYVLIHIIGNSMQASEFSIIGRLFVIPIQVCSVYTLKIWVDIRRDSENIFITVFLRQMLTLIFIYSVSLAAMILVSSQLQKIESVDFNSLFSVLILVNLMFVISGLFFSYVSKNLLFVSARLSISLVLIASGLSVLAFLLNGLQYSLFVTALVLFVLIFRNARVLKWK